MTRSDDVELAKQAAAGDARAFERLLEEHYMMIYKVAFKWCGVKEDAEDIAQEVCVKLAKKIKGFRQDASFTTWLYRITLNTAKDFGRHATREHKKEASYVEHQSLDGPKPNQEDQLVAEEIYIVIDRLPVKLKEAVLLVIDEGLSHKEAAQALGCAETTVSWRIHEAKKKLKAYLDTRA